MSIPKCRTALYRIVTTYANLDGLASILNRAATAAPPHVWFGVSAIFHYLGPAFAVLLFPAVGVLGVAWFRIATAAAVFAPLVHPWKTIKHSSPQERLLLFALGLCLAVMNTAFYLALESLPMSLVAAMEFVGTIGVALYGLRSRRNVVALALAVGGVLLLIDVKWSTNGAGLAWAILNSSMFVVYIVLGHRFAQSGASGGVQRLGASMLIAFMLIFPIGIAQAVNVFGSWTLVLAGVGVGVCSSVIPYICDQLAMSRLPRATFALLLALLPASATVIAAIVLAQIPTLSDLIGILLVMSGIAMHDPTHSNSAKPRKSV